MNKTDKIWRLIPISMIGSYLNYKFVRDADDQVIFDSFIQLVLSFVFLIMLATTLFRDKKEYKLTKSIISFLPTSAGVLFTFSFFATNYILELRDKSPVVIQASHDGGYCGSGFEFREDGTYKFFNGSGFGVNYTRGSYNLRDSIIALDTTGISYLVKSTTLAIRPYQYDYTRTHIIVQINDGHQIIDNDFAFIVNDDNRKK